MTFFYDIFLQSRNIGGAKCLQFTYFQNYWGCYSFPSTPSFAAPVISGPLEIQMDGFPYTVFSFISGTSQIYFVVVYLFRHI